MGRPKSGPASPFCSKQCGRPRIGPSKRQALCVECQREKNARYAAANLSRIAERKRRTYHAGARDRILANMRRDRDKIRERERAYWSKRPEEFKLKASRARAKRAGAEGSHTVAEWLVVLAAHDHRCVLCGTTDRIEKDHIIPLARGGSDFASNLQPLCFTCNRSKGAKVAA